MKKSSPVLARSFEIEADGENEHEVENNDGEIDGREMHQAVVTGRC
jgi:hypothetical protein